MLRLIDEEEVRRALGLPDVLREVREAFGAIERGDASLVARTRIDLQDGVLCWIAGFLGSRDLAGAKIYSNVGTHRSSCLVVFRASTGELLGIVESYYLSLLRTAATTALATDVLAVQEAKSLGVVGTGSTALLQVEAIGLVRPIDCVRVFSRTTERREEFARQIERSLGLAALAVDTAERAVDGMDVVVTATNSSQPVIESSWVATGTHVNVIGSNFPDRREVDSTLVRRASRVVTESLTAAMAEAGDLCLAADEGALAWKDVCELGAVVLGNKKGRLDRDDVTIFKSVGICPEDLAAASLLFEGGHAVS